MGQTLRRLFYFAAGRSYYLRGAALPDRPARGRNFWTPADFSRLLDRRPDPLHVVVIFKGLKKFADFATLCLI